MSLRDLIKALVEPNPDPRQDVWKPSTIRAGYRYARGKDQPPEDTSS